jgi:stage II sporulation protein AA (anti-sigma F factor antagonist)
MVDSRTRDGLLVVEQVEEGERIRCCLEGELDLSNAGTAELMLEEALHSKRLVLIDLSRLEFLDSTGIALLVTAIGRPDARRIQFIPSETPGVRRVLGLTGLEERLPYVSLEDPANQPAT